MVRSEVNETQLVLVSARKSRREIIGTTTMYDSVMRAEQ